MDAQLSASEITSQPLSSSPGSSSPSSFPSFLASNDDSKFATSSVADHALKANENSKTSDNESGEVKSETTPERPLVADSKEEIQALGKDSDASHVHFDGSNVILKEDSLGAGDNGLEGFRGEGLMEKLDTEGVGCGAKEGKVEMGSIGDANQSVLAMESREGGRIGMVENNSILGSGAKQADPVVVEAADHKVVEADILKFSGGEDLVVDATPLVGDVSESKKSEIKGTEVVPVSRSASLENGFDQISHDEKHVLNVYSVPDKNIEPVATNRIDTAELSACEQNADFDAAKKADSAGGGLLAKLNDLQGEEVIDVLEQAGSENIDEGGGDGSQTVDHSAPPIQLMAAYEAENLDSDSQSRRLVEESHSPKSAELTTVSKAEVSLEGEVEEENHHQDEEGEIEGSDTDGETEGMIFENTKAAKQFLEELERESGFGSHSGADNSHDHSQRIDGQIVVDSDEEVDTDEEGEGKELLNSAALAALLKAATGAGSDGSNITITSQDGSRLFSVERPAGLGSSLNNAKPAPRSNRPSLFTPSAVTSGRDSDNNLTEEDKRKLEKLQSIRVKFLRLVQRLGHSPEDSIAAQVLYRLALVAGRQTSQLFSLDSAKRTALQLETEGKDDLSFSLNILVLGKIGVGKSATINSIFGEEKVSVHAFEPATAVVKEITGTVDGVKLRIIDTPGLKSSAMEQGANRKVLASIKNFIKKCPPDIVLYVDRLDTQTRDLNDMPLLRSITNSLGSSIWKNAIVTLTHGASAPPDGPSGSPLSYEVFVAQRSHVVQQSIGQAVGDLRLMNPSLMNPVSLVENHPSCRKNRDGHKVLPNGQTWRPQLLLLCYSMKVLSEASSLSKPQDPFDHRKLFGFRVRSPPLPYLLSWLLQSRAHPKLSADQGGENGDSDIDMADLSDSDQEEDADEYDQLPPFKPLRKAQLAKLSKEQRKAYFEEYDYRVKLLQKKQWREELRRMREMKKKGKPAVDEYGYMGEDVDQETGGPAAVPVPLPDMSLPPSFDADNPAYRYRFLEPTSQFLARPVLDTHGWDHDCGYDGVNIEHSLAIGSQFPAAIAVQLTKDKKEFNIHLDSSVSTKHGENGSSMAGFDIQNVGKQLAYIFRGETKFKNLKKNKTAAGFSVTFLGENVATGFKLEDNIVVGNRLVLVGSTGIVRSQGDSAYGANLEVQLRDADFPIGQDQSSLGLSLVKWRGDLALGANFQSQLSVGRSSKIAVRAGLNNKMSGQITVRTSSSDQLQIALTGILPIVMAIYKSIRPGVSENYSMY
ncbi:Translocon at the outer envelope membrane of chloroplasts 159 [Theobroma cacao]|uniref:Translocon at the outer envelope membrane of chloroplasts 159 n=1 Tax=Theobroma cacao TaxID=3641 RepID=A0A061FRG9_THECC|nr:Translocon at the outer envelope membrane of chloroplasts 159 [Theobroma cacao]